MIKVNNILLQNFLTEIKKNMFFVFLSRKTHGSLGELERAEETLACQCLFSQHFSFSQTTTSVSIKQFRFLALDFNHVIIDSGEGTTRVNYMYHA